MTDKSLPIQCPICGNPDLGFRDTIIANRQLNTMYVDESKNWIVSCGRCYQERCDQYAELWNEYYANCM